LGPYAGINKNLDSHNLVGLKSGDTTTPCVAGGSRLFFNRLCKNDKPAEVGGLEGLKV
jgi:hypothetical protein